MKANKSLGQHFLTDKTAIDNILSVVNQNIGSLNLLEIGPGMGAITNKLFKEYKQRLQCIELDSRCVDYLQKQYPKLIVHSDDFLNNNFLENATEELLLVGNFPYNISTEIVFKVLEYKDKIPVVVGMFQKEVALRLASKLGSKEYGITSVLAQFYYDIEVCFHLLPSSFHPAPKVNSSVILMKRKEHVDEEVSYKKLKLVVKTAFNQRRKMLRNALSSLTFKDNTVVEKYAMLRAEQLSLEDFILLSKCI